MPLSLWVQFDIFPLFWIMKPNKFDGMRSQISLRRFWFRILRVWVDKLVSSLISSRQLFSFFFFKITFAVFLLVCLFVLVGGSFSSRGWSQGLACAKHMLHYSVISLAVLVILILSVYPSEIEARIDSQQWGKVSSFKTVDAGFGHLFLLLKWSSDFCLWVYLCDILQLLIGPSVNHLWKEANLILMKRFFDGLWIWSFILLKSFCNCIHQLYTEQKLNNC